MPSSRLSPGVAAIALLLSAAAPACGASFQRVYEGDVRFEHCYRLDLEPGVSVALRHACWANWVRDHTLGQTRDRVEHATTREKALRVGQSANAGPDLSLSPSAAAPTASTRVLAVPLPRDAFETPPPTLAAATPASSAPAPPAASSAPVANEACIADCGQAYLKCTDRCQRKPACQSKCAGVAKTCLDQCL